MTSTDTYRAALRDLPADDWEPYLLAHANLPGPRGNLELAAAAADLGDEAQFRRWAALGPDTAPENTPACFLAFCGVVGLGKSLLRPDRSSETCQVLRALASDPRWRIREAVAMALQRWGDADMDGLLAALADWAAGGPWEQRAAAAGLCEPRLLKKPQHAAAVLGILDQITATIESASDRKSDAFKTLRQGLAYCWSVAVAAVETLHATSLPPHSGKLLMEKWLASADPDIRWIMRENLKKNRLVKMDAAWVAEQTRR